MATPAGHHFRGHMPDPPPQPDLRGQPDPAGARVLVVEDDEGLGTQLVRGLNRAGYTASRVRTGKAALAQVTGPTPPDLVLLDLGLPDMDGAQVCRGIRERTDTPVIVVTARGDEVDRVEGLDPGSDDYLVKPFGFAELLARMRAVRRRTAGRASGRLGGQTGGENADLVRHGPLTLDRRSRRITVGGHPVAVTAREYDLLAFLAADPGRVRTRQEIFTGVWGDWFGSPKVLDVHIGAIRRKLGKPELIETVYGVGFRLAGVPDPDPSRGEPAGQLVARGGWGQGLPGR
ncbi:response regulator transcription factor [Candidatus Frankia alpina]|uniref:Response regulator transcription factor n=1 Tax=Candidatus Frankia alpina TaxID=2699483 RepID=A0A4S5CJC8_9ACTN|nr:response regulator transcription factor [Candidatus Frankia alpina]THJ44721.1 response regulator transcription factor [Candidatus Frankia alpina]